MRLTSFRVHDFRSVNDSSSVKVEEAMTVLVGRNESGKSSLLRALQSLKPASGSVTWGLARDFPRGRKRSEFRDDQVMLDTHWTLSPAETSTIAAHWPRARGVTEMRVPRTYAAQSNVELLGVSPLASLAEDARARAPQFAADISRVAATLAPEHQTAVSAAATAVTDALGHSADAPSWAPPVATASQACRAALAAAGAADDGLNQHLAAFDGAAAAVSGDANAQQAASTWALSKLPVFVYLDDWAFVPGHHNIKEYLVRLQQNTLTDDDRLFQKMLKVAELDAKELQDLLAQRHEERKLLTDRASGVVTNTIQELWKDREVTVHFSVDADHFDVIVRDRDSNALVPLDERSRGFRWYFSFFMTFVADTQGGDKENAILLLDEPGLFLHATAQEALLKFFGTLKNQIVYTTHSPFMIDPRAITSTRTVTLERGRGTEVSENPAGDANTLFPLQAALGYNLTQTLFVGTNNVVVEGVTDYWYLTAVSDHLEASGRGLAKALVLTPAGGAAKVGYMVALLAAQKLDVVVVLDSDTAGDEACKELLRSKLVRDSSVVRIRDAHDAPGPEADIEDLLADSVFAALTKEAYKKELQGKHLALNANIPRVVRRYEEAFAALGLEFNKSRVAKLFVSKLGTAKTAAAVIDATVEDRFARLFANIGTAMQKTAGRGPFKT